MKTEQIKIKVCGMKDPANIRDIVQLSPDYMGFVFYAKSPRYAGNLDPVIMEQIPSQIKKTGVFVNENIDTVLEIARKYRLDVIQLHGEETPSQALECKFKGYEVVKAIPVSDHIDHLVVTGYLFSVNYILFDTASAMKGGTGQKFNWNLIREYHGEIPFFLSGGIGPETVPGILKIIKTPSLYAVDINSCFESEPGIKDPFLVSKFMKRIRTHEKFQCRQ